MLLDSKKAHEASLAPVSTNGLGEVESLAKSNDAPQDVFGQLSEDGPNYRDVSDEHEDRTSQRLTDEHTRLAGLGLRFSCSRLRSAWECSASQVHSMSWA